MHTTYTSRCPHCGNLIYMGNTKQGKFFASTSQICAHCGKAFFHTACYEWENLTSEEKKAVLVNGCDVQIVTEKETKKFLVWSIVLFFLIFPLFLIPVWIKRVNKFKKFSYSDNLISENLLIQQSIERTSDEQYRKELLKHGRIFYGTKLN